MEEEVTSRGTEKAERGAVILGWWKGAYREVMGRHVDLTLSLLASECFHLLSHSPGSLLSHQVEPVFAAPVQSPLGSCSAWSL